MQKKSRLMNFIMPYNLQEKHDENALGVGHGGGVEARNVLKNELKRRKKVLLDKEVYSPRGELGGRKKTDKERRQAGGGGG